VAIDMDAIDRSRSRRRISERAVIAKRLRSTPVSQRLFSSSTRSIRPCSAAISSASCSISSASSVDGKTPGDAGPFRVLRFCHRR
jgi:hypothetical protein